SSWLRVVGILILQSLAAVLFWLDTRRHRRRRRERDPNVVYASVLTAGIVFSLLTRGAFALAEGLSTSFGSSAWAAHTYYAIPFAAGALMAALGPGIRPPLFFAAAPAVGGRGLVGHSVA